MCQVSCLMVKRNTEKPGEFLYSFLDNFKVCLFVFLGCFLGRAAVALWHPSSLTPLLGYLKNGFLYYVGSPLQRYFESSFIVFI